MDDKDDIDDEDDDKPRSSSDFFGQSSLVTRTGSLSGFQQMAFSSITPKAVLLRFSFPARTSLSSSTRGRPGTFEDSDEDLIAPTPLPPPPSVKAMSEGKGHRKSEETVQDLEMEIEKLQARLEKKRLLEKKEQIASTSESDSTQGQRSDNSVQGQRPDNRECETVPKVERSNSNEVGEELGKATEKAKDSRKDVVIENNINVPLKSADKGDVPISKLLKKDSYSKTTFNQEHFLNSVLSGPPPSAKKDSRGRGSLGVPPEAKITGASAKDVHRSPKQIADGVNNDLVGERESLYWKGMASNPYSGWDVMEEGVFENQFLEVESDVLEITLPPNPNIPHTKATRTGDYVKTEETNSGVKTSDFKSSSVDGFQNESISGETLSVNEHTPDSQNQSGYSDDSMGPPNLPPLKYPDHPPSTSFTSEDSSHSTQLPPKRKSQEMKTSSADGSTLKSELDEKDISDYQEFNNSSRSNYSKVPQTADNNAFHTVSSYTTYMASLQSLADHHGYVIKDVTPDGNCMFSAIVDQLRIQGNFDLTPNSLRKTAVEFLRDNPKNQDGTHLESYLSTETWDEYLTRMGQDSQWGDHMVLQACTEVTGQRIVVFKPNSNKTELVPTDDKSSENSSLTLGHIGESHFVSLRPKDWESSWPLMAHAHRAKMKEKQKLEGKKLRKMKKSKKQKQTSESTLPKKEDPKSSDETETEKGAELTEGATQEDEAEKEPEKDEDDNSDEDEAESDDSQFKTTDDVLELMSDDLELVLHPVAIDAISGIPLPHLSFLLRQFVKPSFLYGDVPKNVTTFTDPEVKPYIAGSTAEGLCVQYLDHSNSQQQMAKACHTPTVIGVFSKSLVRSESETKVNNFDLITDTTLTHPGYLHLVPVNEGLYPDIVTHLENKTFLAHVILSAPAKEPMFELMFRKTFTGYKCVSWPDCAMEWPSRSRPSGWPRNEIIQKVMNTECLVMSRSHPESLWPNIEYQFVFPQAENILAKEALSDDQRHCFNAFKTLVDFNLRNNTVKLGTTHLKSVMYNACETISQTCWENNVGGCLIFLLESLCQKLQARNIPNYFIHQNNMVDHLSEESLQMLLEQVATIRTFPVMALYHIMEHHELQLSWMASMVLDDVPRFCRHRQINRTVKEAFVPAVLHLAKLFIYNKRIDDGYATAQDAYSELLMQIPDEDDPESYEAKDFSGRRAEDLRNILHNMIGKEPEDFRHFLAYHMDLSLGTQIMSDLFKGTDVKTLSHLIGKEAAGYLATMPIPPGIYGNNEKMLTFLDQFAYQLFKQNRLELAASVLRAGIQKGTCERQSNIIDVSDITDSGVKKDIARQAYSIMTTYNCCLAEMYSHLYVCYGKMNQIDLYQEFIEDYEELCDMIGSPNYYTDVVNIWHDLGNIQRSRKARRKMNELRTASEFINVTWQN